MTALDVENSNAVDSPILLYTDNVSISGICDDVLLEIPDAPRPLILQKLRTVIADFCQRTDAWQEDHTFQFVTDQLTYTYNPAGNSDVRKIMYLKQDGIRVSPFSGTRRNVSHYFSLVPGQNQIKFDQYNQPANGTEFTITLSLKPKGDYIPEWIADDYRRELVAGCMAYLMKMPKRSFTGYQESQFFMKEYIKGVSRELSRRASDGTEYSGGISA